MDLERIREVIFEQIGNKSSHPWKEIGNKYYHGLRTAKLALTLREIIFPDESAKDEILTVAAWFHDIENGGEREHQTAGAERTRLLLKPYCTEDEMEQICEIIKYHDERKGDRMDFSNILKIHQDADHLDHFGTFDIWCTFLWAIPNNKNMEEAARVFTEDRPKEYDRYKSELNFDLSKRIYSEKLSFVMDFGKRFVVESSGGIWDLKNVTI